MKTPLRQLLLCLFVIGSLQFVSALALAADSAGMILSVVDGAWLERGGQKQAVKSKDAVLVNDILSTDGTGKVQILFEDNTVVAIGSNSSIAVADFVFDDAAKKASFSAKMTQGVARFVTGKIVERNRDGFSVKTPSATVGIRGTTFAVEVSSAGVTDVIGLSINPVFPVSVTNTVTGTTNIIDKNGLAVKAASAGNTSYMAPAGKLASLDAAVKINGNVQNSDDKAASDDSSSAQPDKKTEGNAQEESDSSDDDGESGGSESNGSGASQGESGSSSSTESSGAQSAGSSSTSTSTSTAQAGGVGGSQNLGGGIASASTGSPATVSGVSMSTSNGVMPSSAMRLVAAIPSPATDVVSPDKGLADIPNNLILSDNNAGGTTPGGNLPGGGGPGGGGPGGGTGGGPGGGGGGGTPVINYTGSHAGYLNSGGARVGSFSFNVGLGAAAGTNNITNGYAGYKGVVLVQTSGSSAVNGGNFDITFGEFVNSSSSNLHINGHMDGANNNDLSGRWNAWGNVGGTGLGGSGSISSQ